MTTAVAIPVAAASERLPRNGGRPARRAMRRWAWRLFRGEWRQQLLVLGLVVVAVAATILGATVSSDARSPAGAGFGTAQDLATLSGPPPALARQIASLRARYGPVEVIENETLPIPGSVETFELRAQSPRGPFSTPMIALVAGRYPSGAGEVALTQQLATDFSVRVGGVWREAGASWRVVGIVENPQSLLDDFALVLPGEVTHPTQVTVLFDAVGRQANSLPSGVETLAQAGGSSNVVNPETVSIAGLVMGMLLIALVAVGGFTVLAQRRLRSLGMLESLGATDRHVRLVVRANGAVVGSLGALIGAVLGVALWLAYRPHLEQSSHHLIGALALPWAVVAAAIALAVVATYLAARRPARTVTRIPVHEALSGRPPPPKPVRRSAIPGLAFLAIAFVLLSYAGAASGTAVGSNRNLVEVVLGLVALVPAVILLAPFCLAVLARLGRRTPVAMRLALRDLSRYRARSGAALAAISLGVLIAVVVSLVSATRFSNVLDWAGPNLASNQLIIYSPTGPYGAAGPGNGTTPAIPTDQLRGEQAAVRRIAAAAGANGAGGSVTELLSTSATLDHTGPGRPFAGPVYVATPQLLAAFGIPAAQVGHDAEILSMRPGLSGVSHLRLVYGNYYGQNRPGAFGDSSACPKSSCLANPVIDEVDALPGGTSAPNTVITEHAVRALHLSTFVAGWFVQSPQPISASELAGTRVLAAAGGGLSIESKNDIPSSNEITNYATVFGTVLALAILAMTIGLIRSETASDLRTLAANGAGSAKRRSITATTAGTLAFVGAVLGTLAGYVGVVGYMRSNSFEGGLSALWSSMPVADVLAVLVAMPLAATVVAWLLGGQEPRAMARQPIE